MAASGPVTVSELAARLGLTLPTVSGVLADLGRAGLVKRRPASRVLDKLSPAAPGMRPAAYRAETGPPGRGRITGG
jgi:DNA-binding transcriptional ArsR family regulator